MMLDAACSSIGIRPLQGTDLGLPQFSAPIPVAYRIPPFADVRLIGQFRMSGSRLFPDVPRTKVDWNCGRAQSTMSAAGRLGYRFGRLCLVQSPHGNYRRKRSKLSKLPSPNSAAWRLALLSQRLYAVNV